MPSFFRQALTLVFLTLAPAAWAQTAPSANFTVVHAFNFLDGDRPLGQLIQGRDGNFYGTTQNGGSTEGGTVYRLTPDGVHTVLHSFEDADQNPVAGLVEGSDGNFYGTTAGGGSTNHGTVYRVTPDGQFTVLHRFVDFSEGQYPSAALVQAGDGFFYGTTPSGGAHGVGVVFRVSADGAFSVFHSFEGATEGRQPYAPLLQARDGNLYGTTVYSAYDPPSYYGAGGGARSFGSRRPVN